MQSSSVPVITEVFKGNCAAAAGPPATYTSATLIQEAQLASHSVVTSTHDSVQDLHYIVVIWTRKQTMRIHVCVAAMHYVHICPNGAADWCHLALPNPRIIPHGTPIL